MTTILQRTAPRLAAVRDRLFPLVEDTASPRRAYVLAALVVLIYPLQQLLTQGEMFLRGQMWAEMATNYYRSAMNLPWWEQLVATDAGYIPFPQRVLALVGAKLQLPVESIPYYYSGIGILITALLVGAICLPVFRVVLRNDVLRFAVALACVFVADWQTRTFINFTYFGLLLLVFIAAYALVERRAEAPYWMWIMPVLMLSKPALLTVIPFIVIAAVFSRRRFRIMAASTVLVGLVQLGFLAVAAKNGSSVNQSGAQSSLVEKLWAGVLYFFGWLGRIVLGDSGSLGSLGLIVAGVVLFAVLVLLVLRGRHAASALIVGAVGVVFFSMLLNAISFPTDFQANLAYVAAYPERRLIGSTIALFVIVAAVLAVLFDNPRWARLTVSVHGLRGTLSAVSVLVFLIWFGLSGWLGVVARSNQPLSVGSANVSQWQAQGPNLASAQGIVCIPLGPLGWVDGRGCRELSTSNQTVNGVFFGVTEPAVTTLETAAPASVTKASVASVGIMVKPEFGSGTVTGRVELVSADGTVTTLVAASDIPSSGGLLQFGAQELALTPDVVSARFVFDQPVEIGYGDDHTPEGVLSVIWMGA
ncbi:hypothetical protein [Herbiconiux sp. YIM B11900]|uniref:hypothetical protein n=1 Tax=Herbiconiux sp. YIM B11900 TaxID=3404131 RepID=UPI003F844C0D